MNATRRRRVRFRPPGVRPGGKVGPWGPFRGRLGAQWWVASIVVGALTLVAGAWFFLRATRPPPPWTPVARVAALPPGSARDLGAGVFVARLEDGRPAALRERPGCPLEVTESRYRDCEGNLFTLDGDPEGNAPALERIPVQVYRGEIFLRLAR